MVSALALAVLSATAASCTTLLKSGNATFQSKGVIPPESGVAPPEAGRTWTAQSTFGFDAYLKAPKPQSSAWFGYYVAADSNRPGIAVIAPLEDIESEGGVIENAGAAYLFEPSDGQWRPTPLPRPNPVKDDGIVPPTILPHDVPPLPIWESMSIAMDDDVVVVGVVTDDGGGTTPFDASVPESGAVHVYDRNHLEAQPDYVKAPHPEVNALFGTGLALSGSRLAVSAPQEGGTGTVFIFERVNGHFVSPPLPLKAEYPDLGELFGTSVALNGDLLAVGATTEDEKGTGYDPGFSTKNLGTAVGAVYTYRFHTLGGWKFDRYLKPNLNDDFAYLGLGLALDDRAVYAGAVGASACNSSDVRGSSRGALYEFAEDHSITEPPPRCVSPDAMGGLFGWGVAVTQRNLVVSAPWDGSGDGEPDAAKSLSGSVYVYGRGATEAGTEAWVESQPRLRAPNADVKDVFGSGVAAVDGFIAVGAPREWGGESGPGANMADNSVAEAGAVYVFVQPKQ